MECAKAEFLKSGFQAAQLKNIVAEAKVTTGAVYRHFKDKEALFFALIEDVYTYTLEFLDRTADMDVEGIKKSIESDSAKASYTNTMVFVNYMYDHLDEFRLLLKHSKGSRVENFIEEITNRYAKQNTEFVRLAYEAGYAKCVPSEMEIHILTHGYISALCECISHDVPYEEAADYIKSITKFHHYGWYGVLGLPIN
jgi:AcrR family transcriptional regulator